MKIAELRKRRIAVLGFGREGMSACRFLHKHLPGVRVGIADAKQPADLGEEAKNLVEELGLKTHFGDTYLDALADYDVVVKSPGIPNHVDDLIKQKNPDIAITSPTNIFFSNRKGRIVGVTGTKGKSTTTSLIHHVLSAAHPNALLIGNIGIPALDFIEQEDMIFVFELSSHQLDYLDKSPEIAVLLNIVPEHLDYYKSYDAYVKAKTHIFLHQSADDKLILCSDFPDIVRLTDEARSERLFYSLEKKENQSCRLLNDAIYCRENGSEHLVIHTRDIPLAGRFNILNVMPAIITARLFGMENDAVREAIKTFKPLEHRLQLVACVDSVRFYDDSLATVPEATIEAIYSFGSEIDTILLGGHDRSLQYDGLARCLLESGISNIILFPETGQKIYEELLKLSSTLTKKVYFVNSMAEAVDIAKKHTQPGKICLHSPAASSFGMFSNYKERSKCYVDCINKRS